MGLAMRAARKQADPQMAVIVPASRHARWWRQAGTEGEVRLLDTPIRIPARGRQSFPAAVMIFGRPARVVEWDGRTPGPP
jgi:hypothetical protein